MPSSSSSLATRSTFSSRALVKTFLIARSPLRRHVRGRLAGGDADQSFLRRAGDQLAFAVVDQPARQPARTLRAGAVDRVQQPVVGAERTVEQKRVVEGGHLHVRLVVADPVREGCGAEPLEGGRVGVKGGGPPRGGPDLS